MPSWQTRQPAFRFNPASVPLVCPFRRAGFATVPKPEDGLAQDAPRDRTAHRSTSPGLPVADVVVRSFPAVGAG
jgi:hypothetical protein